MRCGTVPYCALLFGPVLCRAVPWCAVLSAWLYFLFRACATTVVSCQVPAELGLAHQRTAALAQQSAAPCGAALCRVLPCCVLCCTYSFVHASIIRSIIPRTGTINILHRFVHIALLNHKQCTSSSDQPGYICAVSCGAALSFENTAVVPGMIQEPGTGMYVLCTRLFAFFS